MAYPHSQCTEKYLPMKVVDGIAPMILNVPAERGETHPHIKPGHLHARNISIDMSEDRLLQYRHIVEVPARKGIFLPTEGRKFVKNEARMRRTFCSMGQALVSYIFFLARA